MNDAIALVTALTGAVVYGAVIVILLVRNRRSAAAKAIAAVAVLIWPTLFMMGLTQLVFAVPAVVVFAVHGTDIAKPMAARTIALALGSAIVVFAVLVIVAASQAHLAAP